jgi:potassium-transporting ATPase KdpC subunit
MQESTQRIAEGSGDASVKASVKASAEKASGAASGEAAGSAAGDAGASTAPVNGTVGGLLRPAMIGLLVFTVLTGVLYPLVITAVAQVAFPHQANGSLLRRGGKVVGSALIGQPFEDPAEFWGRPSATGPTPYNAAASSGSNLAPSNPALAAAVSARLAALRAADPDGGAGAVPVDLVTASASGLDPHISPAAALYQVPRVARRRGVDEARVRQLVEAHLEARTFSLLGEPRVNVLLLNLALAELR